MDKISSSARINYHLHQMGIFSYYDLVSHLPRRYEDYSLTKERGLIDKSKVVFYGEIISIPTNNKTYQKSFVSFDIMTESKNYFHCIAFNRPYLAKSFSIHDYVTIVGIFNQRTYSINIINIVKGSMNGSKLKAIYSLPSGIENYQFSNYVKKGLEVLKDKNISRVPFDLQKKYRLVNKNTALEYVHFPHDKEDIRQGLRYLKYEEALLFSLKNQIVKEESKSLKKIKKEPIDLSICHPFINNLPFLLTKDQIEASEEIIDDMNKSQVMNRLLQGDVGSGKTIVSFISIFANHYRGDQSALMAPTEALARQHYENAKKYFKGFNFNITLLVGSTPSSERKLILDDLKDGRIDLLIGTHALFSKDVIYSSLGLVIIDELHRFGVNQRGALLRKGESADLLLMSATPIPRTLALSIYGDLDITSLHSFPQTYKKIDTYVVDSNDKVIKEAIDETLSKGKKVYIVAPLIEYSLEKFSVDSLFNYYSKLYPNKVGLLHGNLSSEEKNLSLDNFYKNETPILVTTTVVEVGIDDKDATLMIIYDADNFGLATVHQLRGRVGRNGDKSLCLLIYDKDNENARKRLTFLETCNDGFKISEEDLKNRGPGEINGLKQSGIPSFLYLNVVNDINILTTARDDASYILKNKDSKQYKWLVDLLFKELKYKPIITY